MKPSLYIFVILSYEGSASQSKESYSICVYAHAKFGHMHCYDFSNCEKSTFLSINSL